MPSVESFNELVAARTRIAQHILGTPDLLAMFIDAGGLKRDLEEIVEHGQQAERLDQMQGTAQAQGGSATIAVVQAFIDLQTEYKKVMAVAQAVKRDLKKAGAAPEVVGEVTRILKNETAVVLRRVETRDTAAAGGKPRREARASTKQEAVRAEIQRDATALLALKPAHKALAARKVDRERLEALEAAARALSGKLAERATAKGASKAATAAMREQVSAQKEVWRANSRIFTQLARADERLRTLLAQVIGKR